MDYPKLLDEPYTSFRDSVREYIRQSIKPHAQIWENSGSFPNHLLKEFGDRGFLGLSIPTTAGGRGKSFWYDAILAEELARCGALGWALSILVQNNLAAPLLAELGTDDQREQILKPALQGKFYLAMAATEMVSGSDLEAIQTTAVPEAEYYRVNGEKRYITNGSMAKWIIVLVKTLAENHIWALSLLLISAEPPGIQRQKLDTSGLKTGDTAIIKFDNYLVPINSILGGKGMGFLYLIKGVQRERLIGAIAVNSLALHVIENTLEFLKHKVRFDEPLSKRQVIRHRIAELRSQTEAMRQFAYVVCEAFIRNQPVDQEIVMLKISCYENCQKVIQVCSHLYGAEAFVNTHEMAHIYRDAQALTLAAGTAEIMRELLASMMRM